MGNNKLSLKLFLLSIISIIIAYFFIKIIDPNNYIVNGLLGSTFLFMVVTAIYNWFYPWVFDYYDKMYKERYNKRLVVSKNDKYILKEICYKMYYKDYHKNTLAALKSKDMKQINQFLNRQHWVINDRDTFTEVINLITEDIELKK